MHDEGARSDPAAPPEVTDPTPPASPAPTTAPAGSSPAATISADLAAAWSRLDRAAQMLVAASIAAFMITLVGLPLGAWDSAPLALIVLVASAATVLTGWFGGHAAVRGMPIPLPAIELAAGLVAAILAVLKAVEILFNLDQPGSIVALILAIPLAIAAGAILLAATRRGGDLREAVLGDGGTIIAAFGLILVLLGWTFNLTVSFWTMAQAALPLTTLALAVVVIAMARRIEAPIPVAWIGAGVGGFGAILTLGNWADLTRLGSTELELEAVDFVGVLVCSIGVALVIAGGVLSGLEERAPAPTPTDEPGDIA